MRVFVAWLWFATLCAMIIVFSFHATLTTWYDGHQVLKRDDRYVILKGKLIVSINDTVGRLAYSSRRSLAGFIPALLGLSVVVLIQNGTVRPKDVLELGGKREKAFKALAGVTMGSVSVAIITFAGKLVSYWITTFRL